MTVLAVVAVPVVMRTAGAGPFGDPHIHIGTGDIDAWGPVAKEADGGEVGKQEQSCEP